MKTTHRFPRDEFPRTPRSPKLVRSVIRHYVRSFLGVRHSVEDRPIEEHPHILNPAQLARLKSKEIETFTCGVKLIRVDDLKGKRAEFCYPSHIAVELMVKEPGQPGRLQPFTSFIL